MFPTGEWENKALRAREGELVRCQRLAGPGPEPAVTGAAAQPSPQLHSSCRPGVWTQAPGTLAQ